MFKKKKRMKTVPANTKTPFLRKYVSLRILPWRGPMPCEIGMSSKGLSNSAINEPTLSKKAKSPDLCEAERGTLNRTKKENT